MRHPCPRVAVGTAGPKPTPCNSDSLSLGKPMVAIGYCWEICLKCFQYVYQHNTVGKLTTLQHCSKVLETHIEKQGIQKMTTPIWAVGSNNLPWTSGPLYMSTCPPLPVMFVFMMICLNFSMQRWKCPRCTWLVASEPHILVWTLCFGVKQDTLKHIWINDGEW